MNETHFMKFIQSKNTLKYMAIILSVIFLIGWIILYVNENHIYELDPSTVDSDTLDHYGFWLDSATWENDNMEITEDNIKISGWIATPGESIERTCIHVVLKSNSSGKYYVLPTNVETREEITSKIDDGNNYDECGFSCDLPYWGSDASSESFTVYILYELNNHKEKLINTNIPLQYTTKENSNEG